MWAGRTIEQKRQLASEITEAFEKVGTPADHVHIIFKDHLKQDWAIGGKLASEAEPES
jgi:4-oxalocrotonate tautomerase family enzyme